ncbi:hypothetical protein [Virgibacillus chiguensis]|nr:hypothetical protein [Virgibacillus chiguensis]
MKETSQLKPLIATCEARIEKATASSCSSSSYEVAPKNAFQ